MRTGFYVSCQTSLCESNWYYLRLGARRSFINFSCPAIGFLLEDIGGILENWRAIFETFDSIFENRGSILENPFALLENERFIRSLSADIRKSL